MRIPLLALFALTTFASAKTVEYNLIIAEQEVNITGKPVMGMTINGGIPGPTLRFRIKSGVTFTYRFLIREGEVVRFIMINRGVGDLIEMNRLIHQRANGRTWGLTPGEPKQIPSNWLVNAKIIISAHSAWLRKHPLRFCRIGN